MERPPPKLPIAAALLVHTSGWVLRIGGGASLVVIVYGIAKLAGHPIADRALGEAMFCVSMIALLVWFACGLVALIAERMRGL
jgi:hypothetical protein